MYSIYWGLVVITLFFTTTYHYQNWIHDSNKQQTTNSFLRLFRSCLFFLSSFFSSSPLVLLWDILRYFSLIFFLLLLGIPSPPSELIFCFVFCFVFVLFCFSCLLCLYPSSLSLSLSLAILYSYRIFLAQVHINTHTKLQSHLDKSSHFLFFVLLHERKVVPYDRWEIPWQQQQLLLLLRYYENYFRTVRRSWFILTIFTTMTTTTTNTRINKNKNKNKKQLTIILDCFYWRKICRYLNWSIVILDISVTDVSRSCWGHHLILMIITHHHHHHWCHRFLMMMIMMTTMTMFTTTTTITTTTTSTTIFISRSGIGHKLLG